MQPALDGCKVTLHRCKPTLSRCRLAADRCRPHSTVAGRRKPPAFKKERPSGINGSRRARNTRRRAPFSTRLIQLSKNRPPRSRRKAMAADSTESPCPWQQGSYSPQEGINSHVLTPPTETRYTFLPQPCRSPRELFDKRWTGPGSGAPAARPSTTRSDPPGPSSDRRVTHRISPVSAPDRRVKSSDRPAEWLDRPVSSPYRRVTSLYRRVRSLDRLVKPPYWRIRSPDRRVKPPYWRVRSSDWRVKPPQCPP